ncbi:hypothetical protein PTKIN_Ptkin15bG0029200 [Pterospermum kingtungense]
MAAQPVQSRPSPDSGGGTQEEKNEPSPSIKLGLGIDGNTLEKRVMEQREGVLTTAQLHELQLQALIFKHIASGIPVPVNLVMPVRKSVASSFGSAHGRVYEQYPSFVGVSPQGFDYRNMVDPEPGRCRRTDGKKWRCSKNVIPDQKYCEQHMHRGCRRSRKLVEPSQITLPDTKTLLKDSNEESENSKNLPTPVSFLHMNLSSCSTRTSRVNTAMESNNVRSNRDSISTNATTSSSIITVTNNHHQNHCKRSKNSPKTSEKGEEKLPDSDSNIINRSDMSGIKAAAINSITPGLGFSPKSVLQVLGCSNSHVYKTEKELEPGRCRRTDGKRWRCRRDVIPDQKYCARHMHRGAKKQVVVSQPVAIPTIGDRPPSRLTVTKKTAGATLSTSLSISTPSPQLIAQDEKSTSSGSETTISDTTITVYDNGGFLD